MRVTFEINDKANPPGKLADATLEFDAASDGALQGLRLIGFAVWERRTGGGRNVTFPARTYSVNGERRSFALLRPGTGATDTTESQARIRNLILEAFDAYEDESARIGEGRISADCDRILR